MVLVSEGSQVFSTTQIWPFHLSRCAFLVRVCSSRVLPDWYGFLCGCENEYLGADTPTKRAALAWVPRVSVTLSLIGSLYIIANCAKSNVKRQKMLPQLLILMSIFDVFGIDQYDPDGMNEGVLSGTNDLALPVYDSAGGSASVINGPVYGAHGNDITCTAQIRGLKVTPNLKQFFACPCPYC